MLITLKPILNLYILYQLPNFPLLGCTQLLLAFPNRPHLLIINTLELILLHLFLIMQYNPQGDLKTASSTNLSRSLYYLLNKMGGKESAISQEDLEKVQSNHPQFKRIRLVNQLENKMLQVEFTVGSSKDLSGWGEELKKMQRHDCLFLPEEYNVERQFVCGEGGVCKINYPYYQYLLSDYIARFDEQDHLYENQKVWYLLFQLCEAATIFHSEGQKIGDVRPINIFLDNSERVKIGNRLSWPHAATNYEKSIFDKEVTFLAPEELKELSFGHNEPNTDLQLAESFSVGLTVLDRAILTDSSSLYNLTACRLQYQKLEERIAKLWSLTHFDQLLKQIIEGLCKADSAQRLRCRVIFDWLRKYKQNIVGRNPPKFTDYPPFLTPKKPMPIPKNLYVESQVVSQFRGKVQPEPAGPFHSHREIIESTYQPIAAKPIELRPIQPIQPVILSEDFNLTLRKIEQQLQRSRKMFPS